MYVCVCKGVTDSNIRQAIGRGDTREQLTERLQIGKECGQCRRQFQAMLNDTPCRQECAQPC